MGRVARLASQLRKPSGLYGRFIITRRLSRLNASLNQSTLSALAIRPADQVLEVGFGPGDLLGLIAPLVPDGSVAGADFSPEMVRFCERRFAALVKTGHLRLECASAQAMPFADGAFTKACTVNTIYFWSDPSSVLRELGRVLVQGGKLVVTFSPYETMKDLPVTQHGFVLYHPGQVRALLDETGFADVEMLPGVGPHGDFLCAIGTKR